jgi:hypothetical protein
MSKFVQIKIYLVEEESSPNSGTRTQFLFLEILIAFAISFRAKLFLEPLQGLRHLLGPFRVLRLLLSLKVLHDTVPVEGFGTLQVTHFILVALERAVGNPTTRTDVLRRLLFASDK